MLNSKKVETNSLPPRDSEILHFLREQNARIKTCEEMIIFELKRIPILVEENQRHSEELALEKKQAAWATTMNFYFRVLVILAICFLVNELDLLTIHHPLYW